MLHDTVKKTVGFLHSVLLFCFPRPIHEAEREDLMAETGFVGKGELGIWSGDLKERDELNRKFDSYRNDAFMEK